MAVLVVLSGWERGLRKVALSKLLREHAGLSLAEAHEAVNMLLDGEAVTIPMPTAVGAATFVAAAEEIGAIAAVAAPV